jgi:type II secretory ATPase GspE/PulE/Tfp pilus assembly ATPase PilB-like protein
VHAEGIGSSEQLMGLGMHLGASDLHIDPITDGFLLRARVDGKLMELRRIDHAAGVLLGNQLKADTGIDPGANFAPRSSRHAYSIAGKQIDIRITLVPCASGEKIAIRLLDPDRIKHHIDELGLETDGLRLLKDWLSGLNGMFLVSGPTSSGKTTTLYALLHQMAKLGAHVLTIEDPVEYEIDGINQIQVDRQHGLDFAVGLKTMLRLDPDYLLVGEMRDAETVEVAASAANSGHVLLSTIHSRDAVSAITALRNYGMGGNQIAVTAAVIINQRLVRKLCPHCRKGGSPISSADRTWLIEHQITPSGTAWEASGCGECHGLGYAGRSGIFEIWRLDAVDYDMLLSGADERSIRRKLARNNHHTLVADGWEKARIGTTSLEEIRRATGALRADDWPR